MKKGVNNVVVKIEHTDGFILDTIFKKAFSNCFFLFIVFLLSATKAFGSIRENMGEILGANPLILYGKNETYAKSVRNFYMNFNIACEIAKADTIPTSIIKQRNVIAIGTKDSIPLLSYALKKSLYPSQILLL